MSACHIAVNHACVLMWSIIPGDSADITLKATNLKLSKNLQEIFQKLFGQKLKTVKARTEARVKCRGPFDGKARYIHKVRRSRTL